LAKTPLSNISNKKIHFKTKRIIVTKSKDNLSKLINNKILPLPWFFWPKEGRLIMGLIAFWSISGIFILGSASWWVANREMGDGAFYIKRQIIWLLASWSIFYLAININLKRWLKVSGPCLLIGMALIAITSFFGSTVNGSTRWLIIGPLQVQPSELIKPFIILQSAKLFGQWERITSEKKLFWLTIFGSIILLIIKQPNLSTAALTGILLWMIALAANIDFRYLLNTACSGLVIGSLSIFSNEYQKIRVMSFLNPWQDPQGSGYQLVQSLYAIGSGGLFGEGYGLSMQKLQYLPIQSTDFIFAVFAEEFGFVGSTLLLLFLLVIAYLTFKISINCRNNYSKLIAIGSGTILVGQSIMHIAVSSGAMPTTGLPLPFISYGGNSLISSLLIAGLLVRTSIESSDLLVKNTSNRLLTR
tara:strand:- start:807 stop:2054 length:1248 start_codon:yes stop_codon:yes gene_type:complete